MWDHFASIAHGASQEDLDKLLEVYPDAPESLLELLKLVDGTLLSAYSSTVSSLIKSYSFSISSSRYASKLSAITVSSMFLIAQMGPAAAAEADCPLEEGTELWREFREGMTGLRAVTVDLLQNHMDTLEASILLIKALVPSPERLPPPALRTHAFAVNQGQDGQNSPPGGWPGNGRRPRASPPPPASSTSPPPEPPWACLSARPTGKFTSWRRTMVRAVSGGVMEIQGEGQGDSAVPVLRTAAPGDHRGQPGAGVKNVHVKTFIMDPGQAGDIPPC